MDIGDWIGNNKAPFACNGASNHSEQERERHDFYATDPEALRLLLNLENFDKNIWECACGAGHLSEVLKERGHNVISTDLIGRGYEDYRLDFLKFEGNWDGDIITNPPYKYAKEFVFKAIETIPTGKKVAMFLKLTFLESFGRKELFDKYPPKYLYVSRGRLGCARNGDFANNSTSAVAYAWFIWEKGFKGEPIVRWFN